MKQKEITIQGKQHPVIFTLATISNFEEITNTSFFEANFNTINNNTALIMAAALAADENTKLTVKDIRGNEDLEAYRQISEAAKIIGELTKDFFKVTEADKQADKEEQAGEEEQGKEGKPAKN